MWLWPWTLQNTESAPLLSPGGQAGRAERTVQQPRQRAPVKEASSHPGTAPAGEAQTAPWSLCLVKLIDTLPFFPLPLAQTQGPQQVSPVKGHDPGGSG